ncbi:MAG: hypothetical protein HQM06_17140 [Magnetococcales bacterium]|nr:hypothetical protein [Magnetococcales bacterium]
MSIERKLTKMAIPRQKQGQRAAPGLTLKRRKLFLAALAQSGVITAAAEAAGMSRGCAYLQRAKDPDFAEQWESALEEFADSLESEAYRRAVEGWEEPIFHGGQEVGTIRRYSDSLLRDMLRARVPRYKPAPSAPPPAETPEPAEADLTKIAMKIAYALAVAKKNQEKSRC